MERIVARTKNRNLLDEEKFMKPGAPAMMTSPLPSVPRSARFVAPRIPAFEVREMLHRMRG